MAQQISCALRRLLQTIRYVIDRKFLYCELRASAKASLYALPYAIHYLMSSKVFLNTYIEDHRPVSIHLQGNADREKERHKKEEENNY